MPGARRASFFDHSPPVPAFAPPHQTIWSTFSFLFSLFSPNAWQIMIFLDPLDVLIPKSHFHFFAKFWVRVTSGAWGSVSVGFPGGA